MGALASPKAGLALAGIVLLVAAGLIQVGVVPASIPCPPGTPGCGNPPSITSSFTYTTTGLNISFLDTSFVQTIPTTSVAVSVTWGDGHSATVGYHGTQAHGYASPGGSFVITETDTATFNGFSYHATSSHPVTVASSGGGSGKGTGNTSTNTSCAQNGHTSTCAYFGSVTFSAVNCSVISSLSVILQDSTVLDNMAVTSDVWSFGDGTTANGMVGGTVSHTYAKAGTYQISEYIVATGVTAPNTQVTWSKSVTANVTVPLAACGGITPTSGSAPSLNAAAAALAFAAVLVFATIVVPGWWKAATLVIAVGGGVLVYVALAMPGLL